jgi:hypothetical protein
VKLAPQAVGYWCVYLMRRGAWWRVGKSRLLSTWGFGVKHRLSTEDGEEAWILSVHTSNAEATIQEQLILAQYGIPTTTWSESASSRRTMSDVARLYERLDLSNLNVNALRLLADHGRSPEYPFLRKLQTRDKIGRRTSLLLRACNLLPQVMMVPVPDRGQTPRWEPVNAVERFVYDGDVHSMDVEHYGHYIADGLVTHNCFYGWKEGAAHYFAEGLNNIPDIWEVAPATEAHAPHAALGEGLLVEPPGDAPPVFVTPHVPKCKVRSLKLGTSKAATFHLDGPTDIWRIKKVSPNKMVHLTEKPVELAVRAMHYSSRRGENVLDLFGGSGSTLMAAELAGRHAFLMELDPPYCDVIVQRWEQYTGKKAERIAAPVRADA